MSGTATTLVAVILFSSPVLFTPLHSPLLCPQVIDAQCDAYPYAPCNASSKCCGPNACLPSKPGSTYLMCSPTNASLAAAAPRLRAA